MKSNRNIENKPRRWKREREKEGERGFDAFSFASVRWEIYTMLYAHQIYEQFFKWKETYCERVKTNEKGQLLKRLWCHYIVLCHLSLMICTVCFVCSMFTRCQHFISDHSMAGHFPSYFPVIFSCLFRLSYSLSLSRTRLSYILKSVALCLYWAVLRCVVALLLLLLFCLFSFLAVFASFFLHSIFTFFFQVVFDWLLCCSIFVFVTDFLRYEMCACVCIWIGHTFSTWVL